MIELSHLTKSYRTKHRHIKALDDVSLTINPSEIVGIVGESGAGKSTLLRCINLLEKPDQGTIKVNQQDVMSLKHQELRLLRQQIGMIFQQFNLLANKTVAENILLPVHIAHSKHYTPLEELLEFVGLSDYRHAYPSQLSGGQKQRVGIARALINQPKILLCDEPTSALDQTTTEEIVDLLRQAQKQFDTTMVIVTHELDVIKQLSSRVVVMERGQIVDQFHHQNVEYKMPRHNYRQRVREELGQWNGHI